MSRAPSSLLFTQDSISSTFSGGPSINDEINRIKSLWSWSRSSALAVFEPLEIDQDRYDGKWYCNDNRRLYLFRVLEKQGYVSTVKVRKGHIRPKPPSAGCHVRVRGDTTEPHCSCNDSSCSVM